MKAFYRESHAGFPDFTVRIDETLTAGDRVIFLWTIEGTQTGDLRGLPATGLTVSVSGVAMDRLEEGRIVEEWVWFNVLDLLQQLGMQVVSVGGG